MTPADAVKLHLRQTAGEGRMVLLDDPLRLVELPSQVNGRGPAVTVLYARGNLDFRLRYEPLRHTAARLWVVRQRPDVYLPDVEERAHREGYRLRVTPRTLLEITTGDPDWPDFTEREDDLVRSHLTGIRRAYRRWRATTEEPLNQAYAERLLLRGALGIDLERHADPAELWQLFFKHERLIRRLRRHGSPLAERLQTYLNAQLPPVSWLTLEDPSAAVRLTWLVALLQPHLPDLAEQLPRLYPGAQRLCGEDVTAVARVAYRLERHHPELAAAQLDQAEEVVSGPLRGVLLRLLKLHERDGARYVLRREERSGHLLLMALRTLLDAVAMDDPPNGLLTELEHLSQASEGFSHAPAVRVHSRLLAALLRLNRARAQAAALLADDGPDRSFVRRAVAWYADGGQALLEDDLALSRAGLTDNALAETCWDPVPDPERHKGIVTALYQHVRAAEDKLFEIESRVARDLAAGESGGVARVDTAWDEVIQPLLAQRAEPRVTIVLVAGLPWAASEQLANGPWSARYDVTARAFCAPLPAAGEWSLVRALGGPARTASLLELDGLALLEAARPELGLRRPRRPIRAFEPLCEEGLVRFAGTSREIRLVGLDLLAGHPSGVPPETYQRRLTAFGDAVAELVSSGRRDELVVVLSTNGATRCHAVAGAALPGTAYGPRCVVSETARAGRLPLVTVPAGELGLPAAETAVAYLATGRGRLAPAAEEPVFAAGGLSLAELVVPLLLLSPVPRGEHSQVVVSGLLLPSEVVAGQPAEAAVLTTLTGGALAEVAELSGRWDDSATHRVTLDPGEPRRLAIEFVPPEPTVEAPELTVEVTCRVGRRSYRRRGWCQIVAAPEPHPTEPVDGHGETP